VPDPEAVQHDEAASRFTMTLDGHTALLTYRRTGPVMVFQHTEVPPELEGHGVGGALARAGLDYARSLGLRVVAQCPFVAACIARHPEYQKDVQTGAR